VPEPPFIFEFGEHAKVILKPKQVPGDSNNEFSWAFDVAFESPQDDEISIDDMIHLNELVKMCVRWTIKMDTEKERLAAQLEELQKKLAYYQQ
jgi:Ca2+-binding EF-hand superfamily protein